MNFFVEQEYLFKTFFKCRLIRWIRLTNKDQLAFFLFDGRLNGLQYGQAKKLFEPA